MTEIYFINDYYVKTTSWRNAAKSWLKYVGVKTDVAFKAVDAMENLIDIIKMLTILANESIDKAGIVKEYYYFEKYCTPVEEDFEV